MTYTWMICYASIRMPRSLQRCRTSSSTGLTDGQKDSEALGYIPLPGTVVAKETAAVDNITSN